ncbi:MAG TPA: HAMP domain-containing sensor histidine kinase, partial [bacterium]|nr:HAMP domain-containing sensor histidine kinase [bacterium]
TIIEDAIKNMSVLASQKEILLINEFENTDYKAYFDGEKILQVFNNLISNAIKFTSTGGAVMIGAQPVPDGVQFMVKDTGIGIPEEDLPHIFEKYKRTGGVFSSDDHAGGGGIGLGLAICKSIIEAHKGRIWAESAVGEGTTFYFTVLTPEQS